jgi:DNA-binding transcriptional LysR family regulator
VRIGPDLRMVVVGAPSYFARRPRPKKPQDLTAHDCIRLRLPTYGGLYAWEFEKRGRELKVRVEGQVVFNNIALQLNAAVGGLGLAYLPEVALQLNAAVGGLGLAYLPEDLVQPHLSDGRLIRVLDDWCAPFSGYRLYYPSRRQPSPAFTVLVDGLRYRG